MKTIPNKNMVQLVLPEQHGIFHHKIDYFLQDIRNPGYRDIYI